MAYTIIRVDGVYANRIVTSSNFSSGNHYTREGIDMSLWDLIRDFFVMHVFGGTTSNGSIYNANTTGNVSIYINGSRDDFYNTNLNELTYKVGTFTYDGELGDCYIGAGDWLSTTATAIAITIIVVLCCLFIYKIIKLIGGLIR